MPNSERPFGTHPQLQLETDAKHKQSRLPIREPCKIASVARWRSAKTRQTAKYAVEKLISERLTALLLTFASVVVTPALSQENMPPLAPSIGHSEQQSSAGEVPRAAPDLSTQRRDVDTFVRQASTPAGATSPAASPLSGAVVRAQALAGSEDYMVRVTDIGATRVGVNRNVPAEVFRAWLNKAHPDFALNASRIASTDIVETKGQWDNAGRALQKMGIACTTIRGSDLREYPLEHTKVLILNCPGNVPRDTFQRIRDFVARGGYLICTDWALDEMLQKTFPGYVEWNRKENHHDFYDAAIVNPDPVLCRYTVANANWKLDRGCHLLTVLKPEAVRVVVRSQSLAHEDGQGILAVTFAFGRGQILHLVATSTTTQVRFILAKACRIRRR